MLNPDVVTLDVEMPHMDGLTFLRKIMTLRPMPVVMISTLTQGGAETTLEALEIGAVDFIAKPSGDLVHGLADLAEELQRKVKAAANVRVGVRGMAAAPQKQRPQRPQQRAGKFIFVGASTGGVEALKALLTGFPADCPPTLITQHMPPKFTTGFAERLTGSVHRSCPKPPMTNPLNPVMSISRRARTTSRSSVSAAVTCVACLMVPRSVVIGHRSMFCFAPPRARAASRRLARF